MLTDINSILMLGDAWRRHGAKPFGMRLTDRLLHLYIIGQTGTGKSTLLGNMIGQDIAAGRGMVLVDPHGDLAGRLASNLKAGDVYWDVSDPLSPYGYNPLTRTGAQLRPLVAAGLIDALRKQWADAWGVRMEHLLRHAILALLAQPRADLRDVLRLFLERGFRQEALRHIEDPQVRQFWVHEFPAMNYKTAVDGVAPIANKLGAFLAHPVVRKALTEPEQPLRFRKLMDEGRSVIVNLAKGRLGNDVANILGGLVVANCLNAALSRHDVPESRRRPCFLYVDEFHAFTTQAFAEMLSEVRKYGLGVVLAHQYAEQATAEVRQAIFGNVGSYITFRIGVLDAPLIAPMFAPLSGNDLVNLANYQAYARIMVGGHRSRVFSMNSHPAMPAVSHTAPSSSFSRRTASSKDDARRTSQ